MLLECPLMELSSFTDPFATPLAHDKETTALLRSAHGTLDLDDTIPDASVTACTPSLQADRQHYHLGPRDYPPFQPTLDATGSQALTCHTCDSTIDAFFKAMTGYLRLSYGHLKSTCSSASLQ